MKYGQHAGSGERSDLADRLNPAIALCLMVAPLLFWEGEGAPDSKEQTELAVMMISGIFVLILSAGRYRNGWEAKAVVGFALAVTLLGAAWALHLTALSFAAWCVGLSGVVLLLGTMFSYLPNIADLARRVHLLRAIKERCTDAAQKVQPWHRTRVGDEDEDRSEYADWLSPTEKDIWEPAEYLQRDL